MAVALMIGAIGAGIAPASAAGSDPIGAVDSASVRPGCSWAVFGWAMDPDNGSPVELRFFADGAEVNTGGNVFYEPRPDVKAAYPNSTNNPGFRADLPTGCAARQICVRALNSSGTAGSDRTVGCISLASHAIAEDPIGHLDTVAAEPGRVIVNGWASERDREVDATSVQVRVDGQLWLWRLSTKGPRPDVGAVYPWAGSATGFDQVLPVLPGRHQVCVYALNTGRRGNNNTTIGCRAVQVPVSTAVTAPPTGRYDGVESRNVQPNSQEEHARGWGIDPDLPGTAVRARVTTLGGFLGNPETVTDLAEATDVSRPDVQRAIPGAGPQQGWDLGPVLQGRFVAVRLSCATIFDSGPGARGERLIGCLERVDSGGGATLRSHSF